MRKILILNIALLLGLIGTNAQTNYVSLLQVNSQNQAWNYKMLESASTELHITLCTNGCRIKYVILKYIDDTATQKILIEKELETKKMEGYVETDYLLEKSYGTLRVDEYENIQTFRHQSDEYSYSFVFTLIYNNRWGSSYANKLVDNTNTGQQPTVESIKQKEKSTIAKYLKDSNINVTPTMDNIMILHHTVTPNKLIQPGDSVYVTYVGKLFNGKIFDQSANHPDSPFVIIDGKPTLPSVYGSNMRLIRGWVVALGMMHEGDKMTILVPSSLAYGERGAGGVIEPNTPLIFDMEVLKVVHTKGK